MAAGLRMRGIVLSAAVAGLLGTAALAQTAREDVPPARPGAEGASSSPGAPVDRGPFTPEANRAHRGGGAILAGPPGAPAPLPQPTPPIQPGTPPTR